MILCKNMCWQREIQNRTSVEVFFFKQNLTFLNTKFYFTLAASPNLFIQILVNFMIIVLID